MMSAIPAGCSRKASNLVCNAIKVRMPIRLCGSGSGEQTSYP